MKTYSNLQLMDESKMWPFYHSWFN